MLRTFLVSSVSLLASLASLAIAQPAASRQPTQPVELVVPAGTGGGADQMARLLAELIAKHRLMAQPVRVVNKP